MCTKGQNLQDLRKSETKNNLYFIPRQQACSSASRIILEEHVGYKQATYLRQCKMKKLTKYPPLVCICNPVCWDITGLGTKDKDFVHKTVSNVMLF